MEILQKSIDAKVTKFLLVCLWLVACGLYTHASPVCYAQEQYIAESFGLYSRGIEYYRSGKLYEARDLLERALRLDPRNDEAQGYLDLVNAELKMGAEGKLDFYQGDSEFRRESDFEREEPYAEIEPDYSDYYETEETEEEYRYSEPEPEPVDSYEEGDEEYYYEDVPAPAKISGEARIAAGFTSEDAIWKDANGDNVGVPFEKNWRYLWGKDRYNTYDKKIYDSLRIDVDTNRDTGFNAYGQIVIDPWTFVGKKDVAVSSVDGSDSVDIELKYWSNTGSTINETYRTNQGNIIHLKEIKILDGKTTPNIPATVDNWPKDFNALPTDTEIDLNYMPIRKLWVDYNSEDEGFNGRLFLMADQSQALTSDDPLRLSNNHVHWEESSWLDQYEPSRFFYPVGVSHPVKRGRWIRSLSYFTKDSDYNRLTFLRGVSLNGEAFGNTSYAMTAAAPMTLWDEYDDVTSIPLALRVKTDVTSDLTLGSLYTFKGGMNNDTLEAQNHVLGFDAVYNLTSDWNVFGEIAGSNTEVDEVADWESSYDGFAYSLGFRSEALKTNIFAAYMDQDFYPALSNYRYTRRDQFYSKHIRFSKLLDEDEAIAVGDGIDRGRVVLGVETSKDFLDEELNAKFNFRNVHKDNGKYVETVGRLETTCSMGPQLTVKSLAMYQHLPKTTAGYDPLIYAKSSYGLTDYYSDEDIFVTNDAITDGEDPSIGNFGLGARYDFTENLAWESIYERTNDPGDCPRALFNESSVSTETKEGMLLDKMIPYLYDQGFFELPPYDYYDIYKTKLIYKPFSKLTGILSYTRNVNKHTIGLDDNVNHVGLQLDYKHNERLTFGFKYIYSKLIDVYKQKQGEGVCYEGHHNIFAEVDYNIDNDQKFSILFGEFVAYAPIEDLYAPAKWSLSSLDTQHILRMYYNRKF